MRSDTIMRYVKNRKGKKVGMLVAQELDDTHVNIGWSLCRHGDKFDREDGISQAVTNFGKDVPPSIRQTVKAFRVQCFLYFKDATLIQEPKVMDYARQPKKARNGVTRNSGHRKGCLYQKEEVLSQCTCDELAKADGRADRELELVGQAMAEATGTESEAEQQERLYGIEHIHD